VPLKKDQPNPSNHVFTRRQWLGRVPPSAVAAVVGASLAGEPGFASEQIRNDPGADDFEGTENENIKIDGGELSKATTVLAFKDGATKKAGQLRD
jgi:hypothetical protein